MAEQGSRAMLFPYTMTAKFMKFPWKYYFDHSWGFKYGAFAIIVCIPIFYKIQKLANTPENVKKWEEIRRKEFSGGDHH